MFEEFYNINLTYKINKKMEITSKKTQSFLLQDKKPASKRGLQDQTNEEVQPPLSQQIRFEIALYTARYKQ